MVSTDAICSLAAADSSSSPGVGIEIRHVRTHAEFVQCVKLQAITWGSDFRESVPATLLKITQRLGGVTAGAFAPDGALLGFIFGITGIEGGSIVHWSDMLAVEAQAQNRGIGRRLKEFQRDAVRAVGATRMYWTYDPLVARNAHFNLNRLGARVTEYVPDMYGTDTGSLLHSGLGTDRFIVVWPIASVARHDAADGHRHVPPTLAAGSAAPILNAGLFDGSTTDHDSFGDDPPTVARVEIPEDIFRIQRERIDHAVRWRQSTRRAFQWALANDYRIERFERDRAAERGYYVLTRATVVTSMSR